MQLKPAEAQTRPETPCCLVDANPLAFRNKDNRNITGKLTKSRAPSLVPDCGSAVAAYQD